MEFTARRVVTGHDADGRAVIRVRRRPPEGTIRANGFGVAHLAVARRPGGDGRRRWRRARRLHPARAARRWLLGAASSASPARARAAATGSGWRATTPTSPACTPPTPSTSWSCVDGRIVLGLDDGEHELGAGDVVDPARQPAPLARGGRRPVHLRRVHAAARSRRAACPPSRSWRRRAPTGDGPRRLVGAPPTPTVARTCSPTARRPSSIGGGGTRAGRAVADRWRARRARPGRRPRGRVGARAQRQVAASASGPWSTQPGSTPATPGGTPPRPSTSTSCCRAGSSSRSPTSPRWSSVPARPSCSAGTHHRWRPVGDEPVVWAALMLAVG